MKAEQSLNTVSNANKINFAFFDELLIKEIHTYYQLNT